MAMTCCRTNPQGESCMRAPPTAEISENCCATGAPPYPVSSSHGPREPRCFPSPHGRSVERHHRTRCAQDGHC
eukprot:1305094-Alexandrium_andersonii.AAC.1